MSSFFNNSARAAAAAGSSTKAKETTAAVQALQPWVEKYRPKSLEEVKSQDHAIMVLRRMLNSQNFPHFLFYGPPGTGKTSTILALAKELFGPELVKSRILELNASDERGISVIREKVKDFARQQLSNAPLSKEYRERYPCPPFKIIILDEADSLTQDAQGALRRVMEIYSKVTRFCLCCNYVSRIIDPVASRSSKFRFKRLDGSDAGDRLREIAANEEVEYEDGVIEELLSTSDGDLRRAITYLQSAARLAGAGKLAAAANGQQTKKAKKSKILSDDEDEEMTDADNASAQPMRTKGNKVTVQMIHEIAGLVPSKTITSLISVMQSTRKGGSAVYNDISKAVIDIVADGYSANQVLAQLYSQIIISDDTVDSRKKSKAVAVFSECDKRLIDGSDEHLLMLDLALRLAGILNEK